MLTRVNFRFPEDSDVRYVDRVPPPGSFILSHGKKWLVTEVSEDAGGYCITLAPTKRPTRPDALRRGWALSARR
jgi:hypothetical protein